MLKSLAISIFTLLAALPFAFAHDGSMHEGPSDPGDHSANVCASSNQNICAHLKFLSPIQTSTEGVFLVHVMTPNNEEVQAVQVDLFMDMGGHGHHSAPVEVSAMGENHFKIQNAWFVMTGPWLVKVSFNLGADHYDLSIPVDVKE